MTFKKFIIGFVAAAGVSTLTLVAGHAFGFETRFLAGWWSCMAWYAVIRD